MGEEACSKILEKPGIKGEWGQLHCPHSPLIPVYTENWEKFHEIWIF
jgi:hypothetical protein